MDQEQQGTPQTTVAYIVDKRNRAAGKRQGSPCKLTLKVVSVRKQIEVGKIHRETG